MNKRFEEVEDLLEIEKYEGRHQEVSNMLSKIELDAHTKAIVEEAAKKTDEAIKQNQESNNQRIKGTRQHRSNEKLLNREQEAFKLSDQAQAQNIPANNVIPLKREDVDQRKTQPYIPPADKLSKIKSYMLEDGEDE